MNPIEHLRDQMAVHIFDMDNPPAMAVQLHLAGQQSWVTLRSVRLRTLVQSTPCRVCAVLAVGAGHIHYQSTLYDVIDPFPFYRLTKSEIFSMPSLVATDIIHSYILQ